MAKAKGHECYHCKQWVEAGEEHDCWTTTETALTQDLSDDLREAWERLRETAAEFGEQRIYASHHCIMFSRKSCYFFVRPKKKVLELCVFLGRAIKAPQVRKVYESSKTKRANMIHVEHRDQIEAPITDWMREAYDFAGAPPTPRAGAKKRRLSRSAKAQKRPRRRAGAARRSR